MRNHDLRAGEQADRWLISAAHNSEIVPEPFREG
jgi:hypothetical protein